MEQIGRKIREERRWNLMGQLAAASGGFNGGDSLKFYEALMDAATTDFEKEENEYVRELEAQRQLEMDREDRQIISRLKGRTKEQVFSKESNMERIKRERAERGF
jgi:hypothetical protein